MREPNDINFLSEFHYWCLSLWPESVREDWGGAAFIGNSLLSIPFRNHVAIVRSRPEQASALVEHAQTFYQQMNIQPAFLLDPATTPSNLATTLVRAGFGKQVEEVWMVCDVEKTPPVVAQGGIEVIQLSPAGAETLIQAYIDCFNMSFRVPAPVHAGFGASFRAVLPHPAGLHFVALLEGKPAGALSLINQEGLGGVYNVGTFPAFRGQGVATALLCHLLDVAQQLQLAELLLQTVHHGPAQPIYERAGFRTHFVRDRYSPSAPGGIWS